MSPAPKVRFYRNIVATFVVLNVLLLIFVVYLSFVQATVTIKPKATNVKAEFSVDVVEKAEKAGELTGVLVAKNFEKGKTFQVSGGSEVEGKSSGTVTLHNNTSAAINYVAKTRFLSKEGVLFRATSAIRVPAKGQAQVPVEADVVSKNGDIGPSTFTLPALSESLQKSIFADSAEPMTGGVKHVTALAKEDMDAAKQELVAELYKDGQASLAADYGEKYSGYGFGYDVLESRSDTQPGTQTSSFNVSVKLRVVGAFFNKEELKALAKAKLFESLSSDLTLKELDENAYSYTVERYDLTKNIAKLKIKAEGGAMLKEGGAIVNPDRIAGMSIQEAIDDLKRHDEVQDVTITIRPFWVKTLPKLKDHIEIKIEQ